MKKYLFLVFLCGCCCTRQEVGTRVEVRHEHWNNHTPVTGIVEVKFIR